MLGGFPVPFPHDLMRVTTGYYTVMGGNKFISLPLTGMGVNTETPDNMLDVNGGDIDVNTPQKSYMIGDTTVLWYKGITSNIFVGARAGNNHAQNQNSENSYVGYKSGFSAAQDLQSFGIKLTTQTII